MIMMQNKMTQVTIRN